MQRVWHLLIFSGCLSTVAKHFVVPPGDPAANVGAIVVFGNARFTVLTKHMLRLEYSISEPPVFEDRQTFVVWNRNLAIPDFTSSKEGNELSIDTGSLLLRYRGGPFTDASLSIKMVEPNLLNVTYWKPGLSTRGNLYGTFRGYDGLNGLQDLNCTQNEGWETNNESAHCTLGLISRAGWATFSDARSPIFIDDWIQPQINGVCSESILHSSIPCLGMNEHAREHQFMNKSQCEKAGCCWIDQPSNSRCIQRHSNVDMYFMGHGVGRDQYRRALFDFTQIAGKIPIPRRHMLGVSWSRWGYGTWNGNQTLQISAVEHLSSNGFPLDTFILDMNWHGTPDLAPWDGVHGWPVNWTGYTWNTSLYPDHRYLLRYLHAAGLHVGANLHDAQGVASHEMYYPEMASANGVTGGQPVHFHMSSRIYADSLQKLVLQPLASSDDNKGDGFDFWWTDWQQGLEGDPGIGTTDVAGLNPTAWLNHYRFMNYTQPGSSRRGQIHSRFGGLGGHRYPTQFGGDIKQGWESIEAMIYTNAISANALVAHWAQEMMQNSTSHELFTRTIQMGAWSPVFTMFGNLVSPCNLWDDSEFPEPYRSAAREVLLHRAMLLPYRYTLAFLTHVTGLGMVRPMYYDYPYEQHAYSGKYNSLPQYFLGELLVAPIFRQSNRDGDVTRPLWLPDDVGQWHRIFWDSPAPLSAHGWTNVTASLSEVPVYVPAGTILPMLPRAHAAQLGAASRAFDPLEWWVFPSNADEGAAWCYEDDGISNDYIKDGSSRVNLTISWKSAADGCTDWLVGSNGMYVGSPDGPKRQYFLRIIGLMNITASVNAVALFDDGPCHPNHTTPGTWCQGAAASYDAADVYVYLAIVPGKAQHSLHICNIGGKPAAGWSVWYYITAVCLVVIVVLVCVMVRRRSRPRIVRLLDGQHAGSIEAGHPEVAPS